MGGRYGMLPARSGKTLDGSPNRIAHMQNTTAHQPLEPMNRFEIAGDWNAAKESLKQKWPVLAEVDLLFVRGREDEMVERIQRRTGETRESVENAIREGCHPHC
jgi:uncharacterized protein YjbJ (UPF0337 family)